MQYKASIIVMPHKELLDPQGKTVARSMHNLGITGVEDVRIGKHIEITLEAENTDDAKAKVEDSCRRLLANMIMENYRYEIAELETVEP